mmetsp:Transcript_107937/g.305174  ORF Transcript_107937/g.305174 Transcript_107937/m.305174 type:complete len:105 (+) Transcript_107937:549-863(+)
MRCARHRFMSHVVVAALASGSAEDQGAIVSTMLPGGRLAALARCQYGSRAVRALALAPRSVSHEALRCLALAGPELLGDRHGRQVLEELGLAPPAADAAAGAGA